MSRTLVLFHFLTEKNGVGAFRQRVAKFKKKKKVTTHMLTIYRLTVAIIKKS